MRTGLQYIRKLAADDRPSEAARKLSDAATTAALAGGGAAIGVGTGGLLNRLSAGHLISLIDSGKTNNTITPEQFNRISKKLGLSKNIGIQDITDPKNAKYVPGNVVTWDPTGAVPTAYKDTPAGREVAELEKKYYASQGGEKPMSMKELQKQVQKIVDKHNVEGDILANKSSYIGLHEVGHATGPMHVSPDASPLRKKLNKLYLKAYQGSDRWLGTDQMFNATHPTAAKIVRYLPGGIAAARQARKELNDGEENRALQAADYASRGLTGIKLLEEAQASARPLYHVFREQGLKGGLKGAHHLGTALGTYLAPAVGSHILAPLAVHGGFAAKRKLDEAAKDYQGK